MLKQLDVIFEIKAQPPIKEYKSPIENYKILEVELNSADSIDLLPLPGIGKVLSGRIIKYRDLLGGFYTLNQLTEVYGVKKEFLDKIKPNIQIDESLIRKLDLNTLKESELAKHPYISNYQAKAIIKFRQLEGKLVNPEDLILNNILSAEELERLKPYIQ